MTTIVTMKQHRQSNPDVELFLAMSCKFSLHPEYSEKLDTYLIRNWSAKQLKAKLDTGKGLLGKFTPMYQNCSRTVINIQSRLPDNFTARFWVSFRSYKDYHVALIQPDNRGMEG